MSHCRSHSSACHVTPQRVRGGGEGGKFVDNRAECRGLVRQLLENGLCDLTMCPKEKIGLFMAGSDAEKQLRLTVDGRRSNVHFKSPSSPPPWPRLLGFSWQIGELGRVDSIRFASFFSKRVCLEKPKSFFICKLNLFNLFVMSDHKTHCFSGTR